MSYKGILNIYRCPKGHTTVTIDIDEGTTPMLLRCKQRDEDGKHNCTELARSDFYKVDQNLTPEYEWFMPKSLKGYSADMKEHIKLGGLDFRKITPKIHSPAMLHAYMENIKNRK